MLWAARTGRKLTAGKSGPKLKKALVGVLHVSPYARFSLPAAR